MSILQQATMTIELPREQLWILLTDPNARHLWQPEVTNATLLEGYAGGKGSKVELTVAKGFRKFKVMEQILRNKELDTLSILQIWPKYKISNKFMILKNTDGTCLLTLQKRYKGTSRFGKKIDHNDLKQMTEAELVAIKSLSAKLHERVAEQKSA